LRGEDLRLACALARAEEEPLVTAQILHAIRGIARARDPYTPEVRDLMLWALAAPDFHVRWAAAEELGAIGSTPPAEAYDPLLALATGDKDLLVRSDACKALGAFGDPRALDLFRTALATGKLDTYIPEEVRGGCFSGLARMWTDAVPPKHPSKDAYDLTIATLESTPERLLPSLPIELGSAQRAHESFDTAGRAWLEAVQPFFDPNRLEKAIVRIATSEDASDPSRTSAVTILFSLGAKDALQATIAKNRASGSASAKHVAEMAERYTKEPSSPPVPGLAPPPVPSAPARP
jgi:hypothetical protein